MGADVLKLSPKSVDMGAEPEFLLGYDPRDIRKKAARVRYTPTMAKRVCDLLAGGMRLDQFNGDRNLPSSDQIREWLRKHKLFAEAWRDAEVFHARFCLDLAMAVASRADLDPKDKKIITDVLHHRAAMLDPNRFSTKQKIEMSGDTGVSKMSDEEIDAILSKYVNKQIAKRRKEKNITPKKQK